jgi:hypothetical protein
MDGDLQDDPAEIPNLIKKIDDGWDLVSGWKKERKDPVTKRWPSKLFNTATRLITGIRLHDFNCGLKAYRLDVVKNIPLYGELHRYIPVLAVREGFSVTEIPVVHHPRKHGQSKYGVGRFFKGFLDLLTVIFLTRFTKRPLHFFGTWGILAFFLGLICEIYLLYLKYFLNEPFSRHLAY